MSVTRAGSASRQVSDVLVGIPGRALGGSTGTTMGPFVPTRPLILVRGVETEVSGLEQRAFESPSAADRRRITELRGRLFRLMQVIEPQRDLLRFAGIETDLHERLQLLRRPSDRRLDIVHVALHDFRASHRAAGIAP